MKAKKIVLLVVLSLVLIGFLPIKKASAVSFENTFTIDNLTYYDSTIVHDGPSQFNGSISFRQNLILSTQDVVTFDLLRLDNDFTSFYFAPKGSNIVVNNSSVTRSIIFDFSIAYTPNRYVLGFRNSQIPVQPIHLVGLYNSIDFQNIGTFSCVVTVVFTLINYIDSSIEDVSGVENSTFSHDIDFSTLSLYNSGFVDGYASGLDSSASLAYASGYSTARSEFGAYIKGVWYSGYDSYDLGFNDGVSSIDTDSYYDSGYDDGVFFADSRVSQDSASWTSGYSSGTSEGDILEWFWILPEFFAQLVGGVLGVEIVPNLYIGVFALVPLTLGVIAFVIGVATASKSKKGK